MYNIMLNYALILLVAVLLFISLKNTEGLVAGETPINPGGQYIKEAITLTIDKQTPQFKSFAGTIQQQCAYYDSGNNINTAINKFANDAVFTNKINKCYDDFKTNPNLLNSCYASNLKAYTPPSGVENVADYIAPCINSIVTQNNVTNFSPMPQLNAATIDAIPINNTTKQNPGRKKGWEAVNFALSQNCSPYHSLNDIDATYKLGQQLAMSKLGSCMSATVDTL